MNTEEETFVDSQADKEEVPELAAEI